MKKFLKKIFVLMTICISIPSNNFIFAESDEESYLKEDKAITESLGSNMIYAPHTGNVNLNYLYQMIQHHKGAIDMAKNLLNNGGENEEVVQIAKDIIKNQTISIASMESLMKTLIENLTQDKVREEKYLKDLNTRFAFLSDEFYIIAKRPLLNYDEYEGFLQFEDGVGMIRKQGTEIINYLEKLESDDSIQKTVSIATGSSAYEFISDMANKVMEKFKNIKINVYKIKNDYFGHTITVSGLITATDIINQLKDKDLGSALYITRSMLKSDEEVFLDDITLEQLKEKLNIQVITCQNEGKDFVEKIVY